MLANGYSSVAFIVPVCTYICIRRLDLVGWILSTNGVSSSEVKSSNVAKRLVHNTKDLQVQKRETEGNPKGSAEQEGRNALPRRCLKGSRLLFFIIHELPISIPRGWHQGRASVGYCRLHLIGLGHGVSFTGLGLIGQTANVSGQFNRLVDLSGFTAK